MILKNTKDILEKSRALSKNSMEVCRLSWVRVVRQGFTETFKEAFDIKTFKEAFDIYIVLNNRCLDLDDLRCRALAGVPNTCPQK